MDEFDSEVYGFASITTALIETLNSMIETNDITNADAEVIFKIFENQFMEVLKRELSTTTPVVLEVTKFDSNIFVMNNWNL
jgi:hypothetical protein